MFSPHLRIDVIFLVLASQLMLSCCGSHASPSSLPEWKQLLILYKRWSGYFRHDQNRFMCSMQVHSVQYEQNKGSYISFISEDLHISMKGYSEDNKTVIFKETTAWNKSGHFDGMMPLKFQGVFVPDVAFYKFEANVSSLKNTNFGTVVLIPEVDSVAGKVEARKQGFGLGLAIGLPLFIGIVVISLGSLLILWAVRKGYLRHVPWMYMSFHNSGRDDPNPVLEIVDEKPDRVAPRADESMAMHM